MQYIVLVLLVILGLSTAMAKGPAAQEQRQPLQCQTPHQEEVFAVLEEQVVFNVHRDREKAPQVKLESSARTIEGGVDRYFKHKGYSYRVHVRDLKQLNATHDYVKLTNRRGHSMAYPLNCQHVERRAVLSDEDAPATTSGDAVSVGLQEG